MAQAPRARGARVAQLDELQDDVPLRLHVPGGGGGARDIDLSLLTAHLCAHDQVRPSPAARLPGPRPSRGRGPSSAADPPRCAPACLSDPPRRAAQVEEEDEIWDPEQLLADVASAMHARKEAARERTTSSSDLKVAGEWQPCNLLAAAC